MWFFKKTAESVWNASKNLIDSRSPIKKLIDSIAQSEQEIISTTKLNQLSSLTYEVDTFDEIVDTIFDMLKKFHYDLAESQKTLNILIATNYLIKHGATGFVDEFRKYIYMFKKYEQLENKPTYEDNITQAQFAQNLQKIKSRAHHVAELLSNKQKLLKEKELSMLVKQKLKLYEKNKLSELKNQSYVQSSARSGVRQTSSKEKKLQDLSIKLESLLENYVWKYVDKLDETIESASEKVMQQIDKYVLGENSAPKFQMEEQKDEINSAQKREINQHEDDDLMKKLQQQAEHGNEERNVNFDLLQFQQVKQQRHKTKPQDEKPIQDLI